MPYGPISVYDFQTADVVAPGAPVIVSANQIDNNIVRLTIACPTMDSNGSNLTGLSKLTVVSLPMTVSNPFESLSMTEALALPGVQSVDVALTPDDAGQQKTVDVAVMNLGGFQAFGAACADD